LADSSTGETVVREAAWLDESLRDRLRRTGEVVQVLPEPGRTRARLLRKENMYRVETVPSGVAAAVSVLLPAAGVLVAVGIAFFVGRQMVHDGAPAWVPLIFAAVFALPILAILLKIGRNMSAGMSVTVSPEKVLIEKVSGSRRTALADLPMDELEELEVRPSPTPALAAMSTPAAGGGYGLIFRTDRGTYYFGGHLSREELYYLRSLLMSVIAG
jgi:hypothetical protein